MLNNVLIFQDDEIPPCRIVGVPQSPDKSYDWFYLQESGFENTT